MRSFTQRGGGDARRSCSAFQRKLDRYRHEIVELAAAGIAFRPMVWTADGRLHPAVTRTLQFAAQIAVTRNNHQATAASLVARWKHEVQIAILRRRAAMVRAVLPKPTAKQIWLLSSQVDRADGEGERALPLEEEDSEQWDMASVASEELEEDETVAEND